MTGLKSLMKARGLSQAEVARRAQMSESDVSKIARGILRPYASQAERIACAIGFEGDPQELFQIVTEKEV